MQAVSYTKARNELSGLMNRVCEDHDTVIVVREEEPAVVIMSLEDYNSMVETCYLLKSPKNAERLNRAVEDFRAGHKNFKKVEI